MNLRDVSDAEFWAEFSRRFSELVNSTEAAGELGITTASMTVKLRTCGMGRAIGRGVYLTRREIDFLKTTLGKRQKRRARKEEGP